MFYLAQVYLDLEEQDSTHAHTHTYACIHTQAAESGDVSAMFYLAQVYLDLEEQDSTHALNIVLDEIFDKKVLLSGSAYGGVPVDEALAKSVRKGIRQVR